MTLFRGSAGVVTGVGVARVAIGPGVYHPDDRAQVARAPAVC